MDLTADERWSLAIKRAGYPSQDALADAIGVSKQVLNQIKKRRTPGLKRWPVIANALGVSLDWLRDGAGSTPWADTTTATRADGSLLIPVVGRAAAAQGAHVDGETDAEPPVRIRERWRAVRISGDSGYPVVLDGQTVLVDPVLPCDPNRIVVVHTDDGPQLKRIGKQEPDGRVILASLNAGRDPKLVRLSDYARAPEVVVAVVFTDSVAR